MLPATSSYHFSRQRRLKARWSPTRAPLEYTIFGAIPRQSSRYLFYPAGAPHGPFRRLVAGLFARRATSRRIRCRPLPPIEDHSPAMVSLAPEAAFRHRHDRHAAHAGRPFRRAASPTPERCRLTGAMREPSRRRPGARRAAEYEDGLILRPYGLALSPAVAARLRRPPASSR